MLNPFRLLVLVLATGIAVTFSGAAEPALIVKPTLTLTNPAVADQDDMCIWRHPENSAMSAIITSDKSAGKLFVYDVDGRLLQSVDVEGKPGNIDLRHGFPMGGETVSIIAFNERDGSKIHVYAMNPESRQLSRVDDGAMDTGLNYGFALYHSPRTGDFFAITVPDEGEGAVEQYRLYVNGAGKIAGEKVRSWPLGQSEGCVADDKAGMLYIGEEGVGIWRVDAEPDGSFPGDLVQSIGAHGLTADVEGLTILPGIDGPGFLLASSQGSNQYFVYRLDAACSFVKLFSVAGASATDGIDVAAGAFGETFPVGIFALHNGATPPYPVLLCDLRELGLPLK